MSELMDKLVIRVVFTCLLCASLIVYKYAHTFFYPSSKQQLLRRFFPTKNAPDTLHLLSRIIGIGIVFLEFHVDLSDGVLLSLLDFIFQSIVAFLLYLGSLYILESIVIYNFEYSDEILKRKNFSYAIVGLANSLSIAYIVKTCLSVAHFSLVYLLFLWLFSLVLIGFASKAYNLISKLPFNRLVIQKNLAVAFSYLGFIWGVTLIISTAIYHPINNLANYAIFCILKILLAAILFPIIRHGLHLVFRIQNELAAKGASDYQLNLNNPDIGFGIYEGGIIFTSAFLSSIIIGQMHFGTFYPVF